MTSITATDVYGYHCIPEARLDEAFRTPGSKYARLPQTCLSIDAPRDEATLSAAIGREPTQTEMDWYSYQWLDAHGYETGIGTAGPMSLPHTPSVPLPAGGVLLASAIILATLATRAKGTAQ